MKKLLIFSILISSFACTSKKEEEVAVVPSSNGPTIVVTNPATGMEVKTDFSKQTKLAEAQFKTGAHTTSGISAVYQDAAGLRTLVFENFKTDAGPDLRIYLSTDLKASSVIEISNKVENGNKMYAIPKDVDLKKQGNILIWCKSFSVLFGSATLQ